MAEEKNKRPQIGDVRTTEGGVKQVLINTGSKEAITAIRELEYAVCIANLTIPKLKKIGLADKKGEILMNCANDTNGLVTNLGAKFVEQGRVPDQKLAEILAKTVIEREFQYSDQTAGDWPESKTGLDWRPIKPSEAGVLSKFQKNLEFTGGELVIINPQKIAQHFEIWAEGKTAERFIKFKEAVETIDDIINGGIVTAEGLSNYISVKTGGIEIKDNQYQISTFKK